MWAQALGGDVLPLPIAQRANRPRLEPARDAVEMKDVAADAPCNAVPGIVLQPRVWTEGGGSDVSEAEPAAGDNRCHRRRPSTAITTPNHAYRTSASYRCGCLQAPTHLLEPRWRARKACCGRWRMYLQGAPTASTLSTWTGRRNGWLAGTRTGADVPGPESDRIPATGADTCAVNRAGA